MSNFGNVILQLAERRTGTVRNRVGPPHYWLFILIGRRGDPEELPSGRLITLPAAAMRRR